MTLPPISALKSSIWRDFLIEILRQEPLQAGQLHRVAERDHRAELGIAVVAREEADRTLNFRHQIAEHRPHRLEHRLGVLGLHRVPLEMLRLGERELEFLGQRFGEVVAADRNAALPDAEAVGDHQIRCVGAEREHHLRRRRVVPLIVLQLPSWSKQTKL